MDGPQVLALPGQRQSVAFTQMDMMAAKAAALTFERVAKPGSVRTGSATQAEFPQMERYQFQAQQPMVRPSTLRK